MGGDITSLQGSEFTYREFTIDRFTETRSILGPNSGLEQFCQRLHKPIRSGDVSLFGETIQSLFKETNGETIENIGGFDRVILTAGLELEGENFVFFDVDNPVFRDTEGGVKLFHFI